ncbi:hypothetical protein [Roseicella frigidaeris]|nr:hypothetical protein [Roseicella frigidaeris]
MEPSTFVLLSGVLTYGVPLGLAVRELLLLRRARGGGAGPGAPAAPADPPPPAWTGPLPDCLIPERRALPARRQRLLEDA